MCAYHLEMGFLHRRGLVQHHQAPLFVRHDGRALFHHQVGKDAAEDDDGEFPAVELDEEDAPGLLGIERAELADGLDLGSLSGLEADFVRAARGSGLPGSPPGHRTPGMTNRCPRDRQFCPTRACAAWLTLVLATTSHAQDLEPRRWSHLPMDTNTAGFAMAFNW